MQNPPTPFFSMAEGSADVIQRDDGRWFINMGRPGFNTHANNRNGYDSKDAAVTAMLNIARKCGQYWRVSNV